MISPSENDTALHAVLPLEFEELGIASDDTVDAVSVETENSAGESDRMLAELEDRLKSQAERTERQMETAREQGRIETREAMAQELDERLALEREAVARLCERFAKERTRYFAEIENEVVRLALAIATRVLRRESMLDPLLLRGAVRVALEKVQEGTTATLKVPVEQVEEWQAILAESREGVVVAGDGRLHMGECVLETSVGRVDLGVKSQVEEIERGFFDLLEKRPA
ncbi:MAG TPA: FliH/SctL family protein [Edaphobacter sp.]|nr:FliH/SctL family protein [Edaphobacter sp.]